MPPEDDGLGEKTEPATPKRREEAREKGQVPKSPDLTGSVLLLVGFATLRLTGEWFGNEFLALFAWPMANMGAMPNNVDDVSAGGFVAFWGLFKLLSPLLVVLLIFGAAVTALQVGFKITSKPFELDINKLNPIKGLKKIVSLRSVVKVSTGIGKIAIVAAILYLVIMAELPTMLSFLYLFDGKENNSGPFVVYIFRMVCVIGMWAGLVLTILGLVDYLYQRWQFEQDIKMSKQEIKDEMKNMDGDPMIKRKRLERARAMAQKRMMDAVPEADVVVTNPTHFAVALRYLETDPAPRVVAKGADALAFRIREKAIEHRVPIVEKPELARALYKWVEVDEVCPGKYWTAIAEVLAYVYQVDKKRAERAKVAGHTTATQAQAQAAAAAAAN